MAGNVRRRSRRSRAPALKACVIAYFETGTLDLAARENAWLAYTLRFWGAPAREAYAAGNWDAVHALLERAPGGRNCYL